MPGGDGTGPMGMGSRTGRGAGFCAGYAVSGFANPGRGGRGRRNRFLATGVRGWNLFAGNRMPGGVSFPTQPEAFQDEWEILKGQTQYLESSLKELQTRMEALASKTKTE